MSGPTESVALAALDAVPDGAFVLAENWTVRYLNPAGAAILDRSVADLIGRNLWEEFPEAVDSEHYRCLLRAAANPPGADPVRWTARYEPVRGSFVSQAWRIGDEIVLLFSRADETRQAEAERQRLVAQVRDALGRAQLLLAASEAFTAATTIDEISGAVANLVLNGPRPPAYVDVALLEPDGRHLTRLRPEVLPTGIRKLYRRVPLSADLPLAECVRTGRPVFLENLEQVAARFPGLHANWAAPNRQAAACVAVPGPDGPLGSLVFVWARPQTMDVTEQAVVTTLAGYVGQAVSRLRAMEQRVAEVRRRYEETRAAMTAMQRTLLPQSLPVLPGLRIAAHYRAAMTEDTAGGDWFDAIPVGSGQVALAVGDVVGHGAAAAAVMGQLRAVLAGFLVEGADPGEALARLDRFVARVPGARGATAWVGVLDSRRGRLRSASCGHPPPMVVAAEGKSRNLSLVVGGPLGLPGPAHRVGEDELAPGELLLGYSDGLVELGDTGMEGGVAALGEAVAAARLHHRDTRPAADALDLVCELTVDLATQEGQLDDATLLAVELVDGPPGPIAVDIPSDRPELTLLRQELADWMGAAGAGEEDVLAVTLAVSEAVENAIEHGYRDAPGTVGVEGELDGDGRVSFTITDRGRWRTPPVDPKHRGRGMSMIRQCVDNVELESLEPGTAVQFDRELRRAPVFGSAPEGGACSGADGKSGTGDRDGVAGSSWTAAGAGVTEPRLRIVSALSGDEPRATVAGPVDMTTAGELRRRLREISRSGLLPLSVDLAEVTHLGSAGIELLYEMAEDMMHGGYTLSLRAPGGSPARQAVELSGLDTVATILEDGPVRD